MPPVTVRLLKPHRDASITYQGELVAAKAGHLTIRAQWVRGALELGYVTFEPGDEFIEHFYTDRWYNIFEIRAEGGTLKGWYCNVCRPATLAGGVLTSEDLELDLFVSADRRALLRLDWEDFQQLGLRELDPAAHDAALAALGELESLARAGCAPFDGA